MYSRMERVSGLEVGDALSKVGRLAAAGPNTDGGFF
ncbi:hypothetical protein ABIC07_006067 [Bradyrhizobium sp. RT9a]